MRRLPARLWLVILPVSTGAGLVTHIVAGFSLWWGITLFALVGLTAVVVVWRRLPRAAVGALTRRAKIGVYVGVLATVAYDVSRLLVVHIFHYSYQPFDVFAIFGRLLIGTHAATAVVLGAGTLFHYANGVGFAVAYMLLFRRARIFTGLVWAGVLELLMISLYPTWLDLKAADELLSTSVIGHVVYGTTLGALARLVGED